MLMCRIGAEKQGEFPFGAKSKKKALKP